MSVEVVPAIDISTGRVARATEGQRGDPVGVAQMWEAAGARWLHVVDLDAARGVGANTAVVAAVVGSVQTRVQVSAGIVPGPALEDAVATGAARVVVSAAALGDPVALARAVQTHGDRVAVALDVEGSHVRP
ncbi:MAG: bifunctional 1-(5-phosphoribosyl)-5-((5-phosphoribosylamino)methylideneamino)imidazole-4-carboxamide isomerase/phosphoribosylanthranilate isomerase PriA, partial [Frankia sp.]|nr:bifunctional 1-(5-phosphoribosyl)-5-((5-phosphoribosylamino)methylideneamino)imidazole-4-carboxamide isomerase/phosphoribosylanthranilate isomerase PriA [Frankia sp.]